MGSKTVNSLGHPPMPERRVKLRGSFLQSHSGLQTVQRLNTPTDEAVDSLLRVDRQLLHSLPE
jgi:hypothetical protein